MKDEERFQLLDTLTPRQKQVLRLFCEVMNYRDVAEALVISVKTVKTHMGHIFMKLGIDHLSRDQRRIVVFQKYCPLLLASEEVSAMKETGLEQLKSAIRDLALRDEPVLSETVFVTKMRHKVALKSAKESLQYAMESIQDSMPPELVAVDLRGGLKSLGEIVGATASEDILAQIFSRFCVGK